jgi:magnesium-transporting ATPase (P-type)
MCRCRVKHKRVSDIGTRLIRGVFVLHRWQNMYEEASTSLIDQTAILRQIEARVECKLKLLGATGVEDKLQEVDK